MLRNHGNTVRWSAVAVAMLAIVALVAVGCGTQAEWLATRFDPCGTILANCEPGSFRLQFVESIPDYSVDPTCTIPGACGPEGPALYAPFGPGFDGP